jgi:hypothetical protein
MKRPRVSRTYSDIDIDTLRAAMNKLPDLTNETA